MNSALSHVDTWVFDLDNTLYPPEAEVMALIEGKMTAFVARETGLSHDEAARVLDIPLGTVKTNVLRGREKLKRMLADWSPN